MKIVMQVHITGTRNGAEWPERGGVVDLPDDEAESLVNSRLAVRAPEPEAPKRRSRKGS